MRNSFRKVVAFASVVFVGSTIAAHATTLTSRLNVDNGYSIFLSTDDSVAGTQYGSGDMWWRTYTDVSPVLTPGVINYVHIHAIDWGGIGGLLGEFTLSDGLFEFANGTQTLLTDGTGLKVSETGWENYGAATNLGINSVSPWRDRNENNRNAYWIWSDDAENDNEVFFSAAIFPVLRLPEFERLPGLNGPDAQVPLPAGIVLLATAIGGLAAARRGLRKSG